MSFFFERNAELYVSNVTSGWTSGNTDKIPIVSGFAFTTEDTLSTVSRNTVDDNQSRSVGKYSSKEPLVDFNFSTYINPVQTANIESTDRYLWQALGTYTPGLSFAEIDFTSSNVRSAKELTLWIRFPETTYRLNNCVILSAEIIGNINELARIVWSGKARSIDNLGAVTVAHTELTYDTYIKNKLSTIDLTIFGAAYTVPITNYSLNIRNDVFHVYRGKIGDIQRITGQYTGNRSISGNFSAYLKVGTNKSMELLDDLRGVVNNLDENLASFTIHTGNTADTHVDFIMPNTILEIPNQQFTDLVILQVPYFALESQKGAADELTVRYYL